MSEKQYGMVIDIRSCTGCQTCTIACKTSNEVPGEGRWCHLEDYYGGTLYMPNVDNGKVSLHFRPLLCNHCSDPLCVMNCPTGAMRKDEATGVVSVDQDICIGCSTCANSCPYGAPVLNEERMVLASIYFSPFSPTHFRQSRQRGYAGFANADAPLSASRRRPPSRPHRRWTRPSGGTTGPLS